MFYKDLCDSLFISLIHSVILLFRIIKTPSHPNHKNKRNFDTIFIALYVSCDTCHMSHVPCLVSGVTCHMSVVTSQVSHVTFNSQMARARKLFFKRKSSPLPTFHLSYVTCHVSHVKCHILFIYIFFYKVVKLLGGGSIINEADPV